MTKPELYELVVKHLVMNVCSIYYRTMTGSKLNIKTRRGSYRLKYVEVYCYKEYKEEIKKTYTFPKRYYYGVNKTN